MPMNIVQFYRPSNGTEGYAFQEEWCANCDRDKEMNGTAYREGREVNDDDYCEILSRSFRTDEPLPEWMYGSDGKPCCTQFVRMGEAHAPRCEHTADMFAS
jgi:hypothetical protein